MNKSLINIKQKNVSSTADPKLQSLEKLWLKIEKHEKRNTTLEKKINTLFDQFTIDVLPHEKRQCQQTTILIQHLIKFIYKKSLSEQQRVELLDWIEHEISFIEQHPFAEGIDIESIRKSFTDALMKSAKNIPIDDSKIDLEEMRMMLDELSDGRLQLSDEELIALAKDPSLIAQHIENLQQEHAQEELEDEMFNEQAFADEADDFYDFFNEDFFSQSQKSKDSGLEKLFKSSQLNKMYKRLAFLLHPDKELDAQKKIEKNALMHTLSDARKQKDAFTILKMYQQYVPEAEFIFDDETLLALHRLLEEKVQDLNTQHRDIKQSNAIQTLVWRKFSARSKKLTQLNFEHHIDDLETENFDADDLLTSIKTVRALGKFLTLRIEEKNAAYFNFGNPFSVPF